MPTSIGNRGVRRRGLRTHIVALVAAALVPAFAVGGIAVAAAVDSYRRAFEDRLSNTAAALASAMGSEIETQVAVLGALATDRALEGGGGADPADRLADFHARARQVAAALGTRVFLIGHDGKQALHTDFPAGEAPPVPASPVFGRVLETGRSAVTDLMVGKVTGRTLTLAYVPVVRGGQAVQALGSVMESEALSRILARQEFRDGVYASLIDGQGRIVARSEEHDRYVGQRVRDWVARGVSAAPSGLLRGENLTGERIVAAFRRVPQNPAWTVTVAAPERTYRAGLWRPLATLALGGVAALAVAMAVAVPIGGRVLRPVDWLTRKAERVAASGGMAEIVPDGPPVRVREFERLRAAVVQAHVALRDRASAVAEGEARLRAVVDTAADAIVVIDERGTILSFNPAAEAIFGFAAAEAVGRNVAMLVGGEHGAKHDGYLAAYRRTGVRKAVGRLRDLPGRRKDGSLVPLDISIAEWRDGGGRLFFAAIMRDVSGRKADEARRALLMREVDHRAKNALAVVQSVLRLTPRGEPEAFAAAVEARVAALARVHSLLAEGGWSGADLRALAERELAPYAAAPRRRDATAHGPLVALDGPPVSLAAAAVQPFAMVLHELATNAAKHGALSVPGGAVDVRWRVDHGAAGGGLLRLRWAETGGPPVAGAPARRGFGTRVVEATVRGQLGGGVERRWERTGLVVEVAVPLARVSADADGPASERRSPPRPPEGRAVGAAAADASVGPLDRPLTLAGGEWEGACEREQRRAGEVVHLWASRRAVGRADAGPAPPGDDQQTQ